MSDRELRRLERVAVTGGREAQKAHARARCRVEGHRFVSRISQIYDELPGFGRVPLTSMPSIRCEQCGHQPDSRDWHTLEIEARETEWIPREEPEHCRREAARQEQHSAAIARLAAAYREADGPERERIREVARGLVEDYERGGSGTAP